MTIFTTAMRWCTKLTSRLDKKFSRSTWGEWWMVSCEDSCFFSRSSTCEGHYCFISLTTSEIVLESADFKHNYEDHDEFIGAARPRFELQAGCIKVNGDDVSSEKSSFSDLFIQKVQTGCTIETQGNSSEVLAKHCICDSHLCNFHHLVKGTEDPRPKAASPGVQNVCLLFLDY